MRAWTRPARICALVLLAVALQLVAGVAIATRARDATSTPWPAVVAVSFLMGAVSVSAVLLTQRRLATRVLRMRTVLEDLNSGDLSVRIHSMQQDVLGDAERALDVAINRMRSRVSAVQQGLEILHAGRIAIWDVNNSMKKNVCAIA